MLIEHKIVSEYLGKRFLTNETTWIEPKHIVSVERKYLLLLAMHYTKVTTADSRTYNVFDHSCREALYDYQNQKQEPKPSFFSKYSENLLTVGLVIMIFFTISTLGMYSFVEYPQVQNFYYKFLSDSQ